MIIEASFRSYLRNYSDWDPTSREYSNLADAPANVNSWRAPDYSIVDLNLSYDVPFEYNGVTPQVYLNIRNALDEVYVQDAVDNSRYNAYPSRVNDHSANAAEVYLGMPTSYNLGFKFNF